MLRLSAWLVVLALRFRRWSLDRELERHVQYCTGAGRIVGVWGQWCWSGHCTRDLEDCTETDFCKIGKPLFVQSFDITEVLSG